MSRYCVVLHSAADRARAIQILSAAPRGSYMQIKNDKRSLDQNSKMWAALTDVATQVKWHGQRLRPDDWKLIFLDALKRETELVPNLDGTGFVNIGRSSSDLTKAEMADLITLIEEFGARHDVKFGDRAEAA